MKFEYDAQEENARIPSPLKCMHSRVHFPALHHSWFCMELMEAGAAQKEARFRSFCISFTASTAFRVISLNYASNPPRSGRVPDELGREGANKHDKSQKHRHRYIRCNLQRYILSKSLFKHRFECGRVDVIIEPHCHHCHHRDVRPPERLQIASRAQKSHSTVAAAAGVHISRTRPTVSVFPLNYLASPPTMMIRRPQAGSDRVSCQD